MPVIFLVRYDGSGKRRRSAKKESGKLGIRSRDFSADRPQRDRFRVIDDPALGVARKTHALAQEYADLAVGVVIFMADFNHHMNKADYERSRHEYQDPVGPAMGFSQGVTLRLFPDHETKIL